MNTDPTPQKAASEPQKYIRTFAGDMEVAQKGGKPDLAPLAEPEKTKTSLPEKPSPLHTYEADVSDKIKGEHASRMSMLAAEQDAKSVSAPDSPEPQTPRLLFISSGLFLSILALGGTYYAYTRYQAANAPVLPVPTVSAPIFFEEQETLSGDGAPLVAAIGQSKERQLARAGTVRVLVSDSATTTRQGLFIASTFPAPDILVRNIRGDGSMAGIVRVGERQSPFFILSATSYRDTFAGMLSWEPRMASDLAALFPLPSSIATSTTRREAGFRDEVIVNHDTRVYRTKDGASVVLYGYWNSSTLVIARDEQALAFILERLAASRPAP